jgi:integrase
MATFRNRHGKWQARVARKGIKPVSKSFQTKQDAERWARQVEADIDKGSYTNVTLAERTLFKDIIKRYIEEVTNQTRSRVEDRYRLGAMMRDWIGSLTMIQLNPAKVAQYRDERLKKVSAGAVIRELAYISSIINHSRREWGINMTNPVPFVKKPPSPQGRNRILNETELSRLMDALKATTCRDNIWLLPVVKFSLASAMRRGEILGLHWHQINFEKRTAYIPLTKNGESRTVPLSSEAINILRELPRNIDGTVFPIKHANLSAHFMKAREKAQITDFHFHDLRHMAITRMAEKLPNVIELSAVSGHRSLAMLKRYYHPNPEQLAEKLG